MGRFEAEDSSRAEAKVPLRSNVVDVEDDSSAALAGRGAEQIASSPKTAMPPPAKRKRRKEETDERDVRGAMMSSRFMQPKSRYPALEQPTCHEARDCEFTS